MDVTIAAIEEVYRRRYARFLRVATALAGDRERARDAVQEAFARAIRSRFSFRGEGSLEGWLWRTLANVCMDERRVFGQRQGRGTRQRSEGSLISGQARPRR